MSLSSPTSPDRRPRPQAARLAAAATIIALLAVGCSSSKKAKVTSPSTTAEAPGPLGTLDTVPGAGTTVPGQPGGTLPPPSGAPGAGAGTGGAANLKPPVASSIPPIHAAPAQPITARPIPPITASSIPPIHATPATPLTVGPAPTR